MKIDVFTFVAQVFNFGILVYVLRRFLYTPIQKAMNAREQAIADQTQAAANEKLAAEALKAEYLAELAKLKEQREQILAEAEAEADKLGGELGTALRTRMARREEEWRASFERRAEQELQEFRAHIRQEIVATLRTLMSELADEDLERRVRAKFLARIDELSDDEIAALLGDEERPRLTVVTGFPMSPDEQEVVEERLRGRFGDDARLTFEVDAKRIAGIELRCHGHRLGWSVDDSLEALDEAVQEEIGQLTREPTDVDAIPA